MGFKVLLNLCVNAFGLVQEYRSRSQQNISSSTTTAQVHSYLMGNTT